MGYYYSLRGWLETSHEDFPAVAEKVVALRESYAEDWQSALYMKGWCWTDEQINWTHYIFYGADVQAQGLNLLEEVLDAITGLGHHVSGYFHAQGEDGTANYVYKIVNDVWSVEESAVLIDLVLDDMQLLLVFTTAFWAMSTERRTRGTRWDHGEWASLKMTWQQMCAMRSKMSC